jgi:HK97 family phage portal protein|tara:strand:- start:17406 stop:18971 length:1566 start_codon:yes stop_codon:yes gene_type:complete
MGIFDWIRTGEKEIRSQLKDATWWQTVFTGSQTASGIKVTPDKALHQPAVFACVRTISEDVASLPIKVYNKISDMSREGIDSHPVNKIFNKRPNAEMTPFTFKEVLTGHVLLYGNGYAEIERDNSGNVIGLWILLPENMQLEVVNGEVVYHYNSKTAGTITFPSEKIFHLKGLGHDGLIGYSPIEYARETIGISAAMEKSGGAFFSNSSRPSGILSHPAKLSEGAAKRLRESWQGMYSGSGNTGRTAILEEGMKWEQLSIPHSDAQWLEARQYSLQDIARIYRMPPHMIGDLSNATFSNIESQQISYMQSTLAPWMRRWEQEINRKLIGDNEQKVYAEFLAEELLRGNTIERYDAYRMARESGWLSVNDIRKRENLNPIEGGDSYIQPLNFVDSTLANEVQGNKMSEGRAWLHDSMKRAVSIIRNSCIRKIEKMTDEEWQDWLIQSDKQLVNKTDEIIKASCEQLEIDSLRMTNVLIETCQSAIKTSTTKKRSIENCNTWANSFMDDATLEIVLERSKENE